MYIVGYFTPSGEIEFSQEKENNLMYYMLKILSVKEGITEEDEENLINGCHKIYIVERTDDTLTVLKKIVKRGYIYNTKENKLLYKFFSKKLQIDEPKTYPLAIQKKYNLSEKQKRENMFIELKETLEKMNRSKRSKKRKSKKKFKEIKL